MKIAGRRGASRTLARGDLGVTTTTTTTMGDESAPGLDIFSAARAGDMDALGKRVAAGDDVNGKDRAKRTALHLAAWAGQASARRASVFASFPPRALLPVATLTYVSPLHPSQLDAVKFLVASGAKVSAEAQDGITPLHMACSKGQLDVARELMIRLGANPKGLNHKGENALHMAAQSGSLKLVEAILRRQVNPLHRSKRGKRASDMAKGDDADAIRAALVAAEERQEAHLERTAAGRGEAAGEGVIGPSVGPSVGPSAGPSVQAGPAQAAAGEDEDREDEAAAVIGPAMPPPGRLREKREIAEVEDAPADALAAANDGGARPKKKGKKAAGGPILSFGDDD